MSSFFPMYQSDWLAGTRTLTAEETGVYITLICQMYEVGGPIEHNEDRLHRLCGTRSKMAFRKAVDALVFEGKISIEDGLVKSERVQKELKKIATKSSKTSAAAHSRWSGKSNENNDGDDADASPMHMQNACLPEPEPDIGVETNVSTLVHRPEKEVDRFDEFWAVYPHRNGRKAGKAAAAKKWRSARSRGVPQQTMIDGAVRAQQDPQVVRGYARNPETWINQQGWEDEFQPDLLSGGPRNDRRTSAEERDRAIVLAAAAGTSRSGWG